MSKIDELNQIMSDWPSDLKITIARKPNRWASSLNSNNPTREDHNITYPCSATIIRTKLLTDDTDSKYWFVAAEIEINSTGNRYGFTLNEEIKSGNIKVFIPEITPKTIKAANDINKLIDNL